MPCHLPFHSACFLFSLSGELLHILQDATHMSPPPGSFPCPPGRVSPFPLLALYRSICYFSQPVIICLLAWAPLSVVLRYSVLLRGEGNYFPDSLASLRLGHVTCTGLLSGTHESVRTRSFQSQVWFTVLSFPSAAKDWQCPGQKPCCQPGTGVVSRELGTDS